LAQYLMSLRTSSALYSRAMALDTSLAIGEEHLISEPNLEEARLCRREFNIMRWAFAVNHATVTTPILTASSVLTNAAGQAGNAVLYGATLLCSMFISTIAFEVLGAKKGLTLSMGLYAIYVLLFGVSASLCAVLDKKQGTCTEGEPLQLPVVLLGSAIGGFGAGILWTCQGAFFASVCERVAKAELRETPAVTAELAGSFAVVFLAMESAVRASATLLTKYANLTYSVVFLLFGVLALASTIAFAAFASNIESPKPRGSLCGKALSAVQLWRDPKILMLQCTNLTFGFAAAWLGGYVSRNILSKALNADFIGFAGALLSALAAVLSRLFGAVAASIGKGPVVALGAASFFLLGALSRWVGNPTQWGVGVLLFYVLMGVGRAVYESTNKAIFADFFPGEKSAGAFANVFIFSTGSSSIAFVLGATQQVMPELYLLLIFSALTVPAYCLATLMKKQH